MRYHGDHHDHHVLPLFGPWRWAPYMRGKFHWEKYQYARSFFLSHTSKLNQQKQWDVVSKSTTKIYPSNKYNFSIVLLLTNHETLYNLKILCWASTHLLSQSLPFLQLQVCDHQQRLRSACAYAQSDQNLSSRLSVLWLLSYWPNSICNF